MASFRDYHCLNFPHVYSRTNASAFKKKKSRLQCGLSKNLNSERWIMISPGLDDFRFGAPDSDRGSIIPSHCAKTSSAFSTYSDLTSLPKLSGLPNVITESPSDEKIESSSKSMIMLQRKKEQVQQIREFEQRIRDNPMVLISHLERNLPHEIFEKLIRLMGLPESTTSGTYTKTQSYPTSGHKPLFTILKPKLAWKKKKRHRIRPMSSSQISFPSSYSFPPPVQRVIDRISGMTTQVSQRSTMSDEQTMLLCEPFLIMAGLLREDESTKSLPIDPFRNFFKRINFSAPTTKKQKLRKTPMPDYKETSYVQRIAEEFCEWVQSVGGEEEKLNLEPDKILSLFAVQVKIIPMVMTSIQILNQLKVVEKRTESAKHLMMIVDSAEIRKARKHLRQKKQIKEERPPKTGRYRYGAWFLDVNEWKKLLPGEVLEDPEDVEKRKKMEDALRCDELDIKLGSSFTWKVLQEYTRKNNIHMPYFLRNVKVSSSEGDVSEHLESKELLNPSSSIKEEQF